MYLAGGNTTHAFLYSSGVMKDLGTLPGGGQSEAHDINSSGQVVGYSLNGFLYSGGVMKDVDNPPSLFSVADGINASGQVVGTLMQSTATLFCIVRA